MHLYIIYTKNNQQHTLLIGTNISLFCKTSRKDIERTLFLYFNGLFIGETIY